LGTCPVPPVELVWSGACKARSTKMLWPLVPVPQGQCHPQRRRNRSDRPAVSCLPIIHGSAAGSCFLVCAFCRIRCADNLGTTEFLGLKHQLTRGGFYGDRGRFCCQNSTLLPTTPPRLPDTPEAGARAEIQRQQHPTTVYATADSPSSIRRRSEKPKPRRKLTCNGPRTKCTHRKRHSRTSRSFVTPLTKPIGARSGPPEVREHVSLALPAAAARRTRLNLVRAGRSVLGRKQR